jgi:hypothetical protein
MGKHGRDGQNRLGELLVKEKLISPMQLLKAIETQRSIGGRLGDQLIKLGYIDEDELTAFLSKQYGVPSINLSAFEIDPEVLKILPKEVVSRHQVIPVNRSGNTVIIAMCDPSNIHAIDDTKFITGLNVEVVVASDTAVAEAISRYYPPSSKDNQNRLGELLVKQKLISPLQLHSAFETQRSFGGPLGHQLIRLGYIEEDELTAFLCRQYGVPSIHLSSFEIDPDVLKILPKEVVSRHQVIPVTRSGNALIVAMSDPSNRDAIDDVKFVTNLDVEVVVASETSIAEAMSRYYTVFTVH